MAAFLLICLCLLDSLEKMLIRPYTLMFVAVCQSIGLLIAVSFWHNIRRKIVEEKETVLCYPRRVFETPFGNIEDKLDGFRSTFNRTDNTTILCGPASNVFSILVFKAMQQLLVYNYDEHSEVSLMRDYKPDNCSEATEETPTIKLVDIENRNIVSVGKSSNFKVFWKSQLTPYLQSGLRYNVSNGHVHVETPGRYFIMSQIRTKIQTEPINITHSSINVKHRIHRLSQNGEFERIILENVKTLCEPVTNLTTHADQTSTIGAIFKLEAHDQVYVSTSHPRELVTGDVGSHLTILIL